MNDERLAFAKDGVICLRNCIDKAQLTLLESAIKKNLLHPTHLSHNFNLKSGGRYFSDMYLTTAIDEYRMFVELLPIFPRIARLMKTKTLTLFNMELLIKEPNTIQLTPWHHDLTYWPMQGINVTSLWIPLDPVTQYSGGLEFIAASHKEKIRYHPRNFDTGESRITSSDETLVVDARQLSAKILSWDVNPQDALLFHALTLHRAYGNSSSTTARRAVVLRLVGDDVVYQPRKNTIPLIWSPNLNKGEPFANDNELFISLIK